MGIFRRRREARRIAIEAYNECNGDQSKLESLFKHKAAEAGMDPATILTLLMIAWKLWKWAKDNNLLSIGPEHEEETLKLALEGATDE